MTYTDKQQDNILFRKWESQKKKGKKKLSFLSRSSIWFFYIRAILVSAWSALVLATISICFLVGTSKWCYNNFGIKTIGLFWLIIFTFLLIKFFWWDRQKWKIVGEPEFKRKTGQGQFSIYFTCLGCKKKFNKHLETEKNLCQKCFVKK